MLIFGWVYGLDLDILLKAQEVMTMGCFSFFLQVYFLVSFVVVVFFLSGDWGCSEFVFWVCGTTGYSYKALLEPSFPSFFSLPWLWVTSMHHFRGRGGKRQINRISFQSLYSQRELDEGAAGEGVAGVCGQQLKTVALTRRDLCTLLAK